MDKIYFSLIQQPPPLCGVPLEKLIVTQLVEKFHATYGTQKFITIFTVARQF